MTIETSYIDSIAASVKASVAVTVRMATMAGEREVHNLSAYAFTTMEVVARGLEVAKFAGRKTIAGDLKAQLEASGIKPALVKRLVENATLMSRHKAFAEASSMREDSEACLEEFRAIYAENEIATQKDLFIFLGTQEATLTKRERIVKDFLSFDDDDRSEILMELAEAHAQAMGVEVEEVKVEEDAATIEQIAA